MTTLGMKRGRCKICGKSCFSRPRTDKSVTLEHNCTECFLWADELLDLVVTKRAELTKRIAERK